MPMTLLYMLVMSIITGFIYAYDKKCAVEDKWRVSERFLLFMAALGGAMGAHMAMYLCHHKIQKEPFVNGMPFLMVSHIILIIILANIFL